MSIPAHALVAFLVGAFPGAAVNGLSWSTIIIAGMIWAGLFAAVVFLPRMKGWQHPFWYPAPKADPWSATTLKRLAIGFVAAGACLLTGVIVAQLLLSQGWRHGFLTFVQGVLLSGWSTYWFFGDKMGAWIDDLGD